MRCDGAVVNDHFDKIVEKMQPNLEMLSASNPLARENLSSIPQRGIYVFYEDGIPIYVGRSNRMKQRLQEHSRASSRHNSATFAFNLAMEAAEIEHLEMTGMNRSQIQHNQRFKQLYDDATPA